MQFPWQIRLIAVLALFGAPSLQDDLHQRFGKGHGGGHGGGYGHDHKGGYKPAPVCHPQTVTKYNTIYKNRKAEVFNKVEIRNPQPHINKVKETRHTTIRYPVFITQVLKPLLTQVETKVKPLFFTKTLTRYTTVKFTVTGIGQVTVTTVKYEKEYITRCQKKGYHRREDSLPVQLIDEPSGKINLNLNLNPIKPNRPASYDRKTTIPPPVGRPYDQFVDYSGASGNPLYDMRRFQDNYGTQNHRSRAAPYRSHARLRQREKASDRRDVTLTSSLDQKVAATSIAHPPLPTIPLTLLG